MAYKLNVEKNYLKFIENSAGSNTYRNLYMVDEKGNEFDASQNGKKSCALFVTGILKMFNRVDNLHSTCSGTLKYIREADTWAQTSNPQAGDLVFWDATQEDTGHVGFFLDEARSISNSEEDGHPMIHPHELKDGRKPISYWHYAAN